MLVGYAGTLLHRATSFTRSLPLSKALRYGQQHSVHATQLLAGPETAADQLLNNASVRKLQPISRTLAHKMQHEQRLKRKLQSEIQKLQQQLHQVHCPWPSQQELNPSTNQSTDNDELVDDPLFSLSTSPSVEQLQRRLVRLRSRLQAANTGSLADVRTGGHVRVWVGLFVEPWHAFLHQCQTSLCSSQRLSKYQLSQAGVQATERRAGAQAVWQQWVHKRTSLPQC